MQTLTFIVLVFACQAVVYVVHGGIWGSRPVLPMMLFSLADIAIVSTFAIAGTLMRPLPISVVNYIALLVATAGFALALDQVKLMVFVRRPID